MFIFDFFANLFGYALNLIYNLVQNYGIAIILFSIFLKIILLPLSIKQQESMKKNQKIQGKVKEVQAKYKDNPEQLNKETMKLYKEENMSPFSGCLSSIVQIIILLSMFYLVRSPLTYMKKIDPGIIQSYQDEIKAELPEGTKESMYKEIEVIRIDGPKDDTVNINMNFLGLDLSLVPWTSLSNPTVYIIPVLYVISSFGSIHFTMRMQQKMREGTGESKEMDAMMNMNKSMMWFMPIMSVSISMIAPLGLALYWLINNIMMIAERIFLDKFIFKNKEEM